MSDILASVSVVLGAEISGFKAAMAQARKELAGFRQAGEALKDIGQSLTTYVTLPLAAFGAAAVAASAKVESLSKGLQAITVQELGKQGVTGLEALQQASQLTTERLAQLREVAKQPGLGFEAAVQGTVRLQAVGISFEQASKSIKAFANAVATTGGGKNELDRITVQLAQLSAKGKVLAQDLRPIIEAAPAVSGALQKLYGTVDSETISASLKKQGQSSTDFVRVLTEELGKLPQVQGGLKNALENLSDTALLGLAKFGDSISKSLNLPAVFQGVSDAISGLADRFTNLSPGVQRAVVVLGTIVAATGPVLVAVGTLGAALPAITAGFATLGVTSLAALAPLGLAAGAVAVAAGLIIENWGAVSAYFGPNGEGGQLFGGLATSVKESVAEISQAIGQLGGLGKNNLGSLVSASGVLKALVRDIATGFTAISEVAGGTIKFISSILSGEFTQALEGARQAAYGLLDPLANLLGFSKVQKSAGFSDFFKDVIAGADAAKESIEGLAGGDLGSLTTQLGLLEQLKQKLKDVKEQRDKETSAAAITADNAQIKSLQAQIDKLEGVDKAGKKAADALARLRAELSAQATLAKIFPDESVFADTQARIKLIENGLKTLVTSGISPASAAFKALATEASTLGQGLAKQLAEGGELELKPVSIKLAPITFGDAHPEAVLGGISKELADHPLLVPFKLQLPKTDFAGDIIQAQREIAEGLADASTNAVVFGKSFDYAGARVSVLQTALQNLVASGIPATSKAVKDLAAQVQAETDLLNINNAATSALASGLSQLGIGLLDGLGQLATGSITLEQFGGTILGLVGKLATQLGEAIVAVGIGMLHLKTAFTNPFSAIAAGAALIVVGAALSSISSSLSSVGTSSAAASTSVASTAVASQPRSYTPTTAPAAASSGASVTNIHKVEILLQGSNLVGALQIQTNRLGRIVGAH